MLYLGTTTSAAKKVRELIVIILAEEFPNTIPRLRRTIAHRYGLRVTYQALHKEILTLLARDIVVRKPTGICLQEKWIEQQREFFRFIHENYESAPPKREQAVEIQQMLTDY